MPQLRVYSRRGCHLCEVLLDELASRVRGRAEIEVCDIDTQADWLERYNERVPVVEVDGSFVCQFVLDVGALQRALEL